MADEQQAQTEPEVTPDAAMPTAEQTVPETEVDKTSPEQSPDIEKSAKEPEIPESASERTKQEFEKLKERLRTERKQREEMERIYTSLKPKAPTPEVVPIVDPNTGLINESALNQLQQEVVLAKQQATQAVESAKQQALEKEEGEMLASYPELDPKSEKFDEAFSHHVEAIKLHSMIQPDKYGGKQLSGKEAADYVRNYVPVAKLKAEGAQEAMEKLTQKEQASLEASGTPARRTQVTSLDELKRRTRKGDQEAIVERLNLMKSQG